MKHELNAKTQKHSAAPPQPNFHHEGHEDHEVWIKRTLSVFLRVLRGGIRFAMLLPKTLHFWQSFFHSSFPTFPFVKIFWLRLRRTAPLRLRALALNSARLGLCVAVAVVAGAGCVSQKKEQLEARRAYVAGQEQAMQAAMRARQEQGPVVFVQGQVNHPAVPWEEGMKLSQAIVAAEYTAYMNPRLVRVLRNGQVAGEFKGIDLLHHQDMELENGDTILLVP
jgi:hypothetical protein